MEGLWHSSCPVIGNNESAVSGQEIPETWAELLQLKHLGLKRARWLYEDFTITSRAQLAEALDASKVEALPGFGKKTTVNLRHAIRSFDQHPLHALWRGSGATGLAREDPCREHHAMT